MSHVTVTLKSRPLGGVGVEQGSEPGVGVERGSDPCNPYPYPWLTPAKTPRVGPTPGNH